MATGSQPETRGLTALGKVIIGLFGIALVAGGVWQLLRQPTPPAAPVRPAAPTAPAAAAPAAPGVENAQGPGQVTTFQEYKYVPGEKLPPVKGVSNYQWSADRKVVEFPINVWIGWLPIVAANHGFAPNEDS